MTGKARRIGRTRRSGKEPNRVEAQVFAGSCLVLATHVLADAFVDLRPGTSPADHLVSGTVPVAVLSALVVVFTRVRAGMAALVAILLGLATVYGGVALARTFAEGGLGLGPLTGALGTMAGLLLVALGAVMLWRSRRQGGTAVWRWTRRLGWAVLGVVLVGQVSVPVGFGFQHANSSVGYGLDEAELARRGSGSSWRRPMG